MNILPFITLLILVFSFFSMTFFEYEKDIYANERDFQSIYFAWMTTQNDALKREFDKFPAKEKKEKPLIQGDTAPKEPEKKLRKEINLENRAKLNLWMLVHEKDHPSYEIFYEATAQLIRKLYSGASFFKEDRDLEYEMLDHFIEVFGDRERKYSEDPLFDELVDEGTYYYKVVKGVNGYDLQMKFGYPPLDEFFCVEPGDSRKPLNFDHATPVILTTLFGEKIYLEILEKEKTKEKGSFLSRQELEEILIRNFSEIKDPSLYEGLFHFGVMKEKHSYLRYKDMGTNVTVTLELSGGE